MKWRSGARKREERASRDVCALLLPISLRPACPYSLGQTSASAAESLVKRARQASARTTPTLTDLDSDARVPPLRPLLPEWRNWQTQGI
jgi:hypothetical protein